MADFVQFALEHGVMIQDLDASGRIRRCPTLQHPRSRNGAYRWDGRRGFCFAWDGDARPYWYDDPHALPWTDDARRTHAMRRAEERRRQAECHQRAARYAAALLGIASLGEHNYFHFKGLPRARGLVLPDGALLVPMRSLSGALQGAQTIRWDVDARRYEKRMLPGMQARGAVLRIGSPRAAQTILCEGYATGRSIELAVRQLQLDASVLVCFSDSNLTFVARRLAGRRCVFADHDASGAGERAALATGLPYCMSERVGEDANDLYVRAGLLAVCAQLMALTEAAMT
jgi:putative DNA primase/helicase